MYVSAIPIYVFLTFVVFWKIYLRVAINSNKCLELNEKVGFVSISMYVVLFLLKIQYLADLVGVVWIVSLVIHILLYSFCWVNVEGNVYLEENQKKDSVLVFSCLAKDEKVTYLGNERVIGQRTEVRCDEFIKLEWKRKAYCPRREIREVTFFNGLKNEKIIYTERKKLGKNYTRFVNRENDGTAIITVIKTDSIIGDDLVIDERIVLPCIKKIEKYILSKNYEL